LLYHLGSTRCSVAGKDGLNAWLNEPAKHSFMQACNKTKAFEQNKKRNPIKKSELTYEMSKIVI
jgi:hypothetical protein